MRLDSKAEPKAQNSDSHEAVFQKTPHRDSAKSHDDSSGVAPGEDRLAIERNDAGKESRNLRRVPCAGVPHQQDGENENAACEQHPDDVRRPP
jgi:hypothetical protein